MSGQMMNIYLRIGAIFLLSSLIPLLAACNPSGSGSYAENAEPPLAGAKIGGSFTLTNQDGNQISDSDFAGQYRIFYFGYTYCPDVCPVDLQKIMQGLALAEKADPTMVKKIQPFFVTIDPERDGVEQIGQYVSAFHPRLIGLTGSAEEIADVAKKYLIIYQKQESEGASEYLMDHSRQAYLFGPDGQPLAMLPYDDTPQKIADEIQKWVT